MLTAPARTARPAAVVTAAAPAEAESEKVLRAPARQEAPAVQPAEPTRLEAAATIHDTYEKLPHEEPVQERRGIFSKMKRFFGVDVYEPEEAQKSPEKESTEKDQAEKEQAVNAEAKPEPQPAIDQEALARAEAERAERLKALHAAAEQESAEEVSVEEPVEETAEESNLAQELTQESAEESVEAASQAEESTSEGVTASSGSVLSHGRGKGLKKSKKKRR